MSAVIEYPVREIAIQSSNSVEVGGGKWEEQWKWWLHLSCTSQEHHVHFIYSGSEGQKSILNTSHVDGIVDPSRAWCFLLFFMEHDYSLLCTWKWDHSIVTNWRSRTCYCSRLQRQAVVLFFGIWCLGNCGTCWQCSSGSIEYIARRC